jgi:hypothetical protein
VFVSAGRVLLTVDLEYAVPRYAGTLPAPSKDSIIVLAVCVSLPRCTSNLPSDSCSSSNVIIFESARILVISSIGPSQIAMASVIKYSKLTPYLHLWWPLPPDAVFVSLLLPWYFAPISHCLQYARYQKQLVWRIWVCIKVIKLGPITSGRYLSGAMLASTTLLAIARWPLRTHRATR